MKLVFISNFLNHHQIYLCNEFSKFTDFYFVATELNGTQGYQQSMSAPYLVEFDENDIKKKAFVYDLVLNSDVVIFGSCPPELIKIRMDVNKISFLYTERFLRKGLWRRFVPRVKKRIDEVLLDYKDRNMYVLSASSFLRDELQLLGFPLERCFKWGYFPEFINYDNWEQSCTTKEKKMSFLFAARLLPLKRPEMVIRLAKVLNEDNYDFDMKIVGDGPTKQKLSRMIVRNGLEKKVSLVGSKAPDEVRRIMEEADVFLFTSNKKEGWGAVVNEAMNSKCVVIASDEAGATRFLIRSSENGFAFKSKSFKDFSQKVIALLGGRVDLSGIKEKAYLTIKNEWNYKVACHNFLLVASSILEGGQTFISSGPMSQL